MQSKGNRRGRKLVACLNHEDRVVILDLDAGEKKELEVDQPWKCASAQHIIAVTTFFAEMRLFSADGCLVYSVPESK